MEIYPCQGFAYLLVSHDNILHVGLLVIDVMWYIADPEPHHVGRLAALVVERLQTIMGNVDPQYLCLYYVLYLLPCGHRSLPLGHEVLYNTLTLRAVEVWVTVEIHVHLNPQSLVFNQLT